MVATILDIEQGSPKWLALRKTKLTATDTAKIMNLSPFCTPLQLWEEKLGLRKPSELNDKMREGLLLEEKARDFLNRHYHFKLKPVVLQSGIYEFMMASLDGMDGKNVAEIKCGEASHKLAIEDKIPSYYFAQCQKQMLVSETTSMLYFSYRSDDNNKLILVNRDEEFIEKIIEAEKEFYRCLMEFIPPPSMDRDYVLKDDKEWRLHTAVWKDVKRQIKELELQEEDLRNELIRMAKNQSCQGEGVRVSKSIRRGNVAYSEIDCLKSVDLELYRRKPTVVWRISEYE